MKTRQTVGTILLVAIVATTAVSCKKKGCTNPEATNYSEKATKDDGTCVLPAGSSYKIETVNISGTSYEKITGTINASISLDASKNYLLSGGVFVSGGATLTIPCGTTIYAADDNTIPFLAIERGSKISAIGSENCPIVFTTIKSNPLPGDWGGIIINGNAPINNGVDPVGEGQTGKYGGSNATDNSGTMQYVRVEYAGKQITADTELNGFSFCGVGSGTTLDHLQAYKCADDGFEFFGGTVNLSYSLSYGSGDDCFDFTFGWSGTGNYWKAVQSPTEGDRGIEGDNNSSNNAATPFSNPTLTNIQLVGRGIAASTSGAKFREGTKATVSNIVISDFKTGFDIQHDQTLTNVVNGSFKLTMATATNVTTDLKFTASTAGGPLEATAQSSGNVVVNGSGTASSTWITGTWFKNL
jgi:hypothetical protein